jgi:Ran GTPase-activating protein (RanGAP) involved in mRNA processing and transport
MESLLENGVEAVKTLTKLSLTFKPVESEGETILADALGRNAMPSLKHLHLNNCGIEDDCFVALVSALEQNTSLQILNLQENPFGDRGFMALAESLPNIKVLQEIDFDVNASFLKNTSLVEVNIDWHEPGEWSRELNFLRQRNQFTPVLKASDPSGFSPRLGIWSRALATVAAEPDVLFHVLRNKPKLIGSAGGSTKRKRDD